MTMAEKKYSEVIFFTVSGIRREIILYLSRWGIMIAASTGRFKILSMTYLSGSFNPESYVI